MYLRFVAPLLLSTTCFLTSCSMLVPKATPVDAQDVMSRAARYTAARKSLGASKATRTPLKEGQWVASLAKSKKDPNDVTLQVTKVVDVSGDTVTLETEQYAATNGGKRMVMQQRMRGFPVAPKLALTEDDAAAVVEKIQLESVKLKDDQGVVQEVPQLAIPIGRAGADLLRSNIATGAVRTEACESTSISASKCYLVPYNFRVLWMSDTGTTYAHSDVPIVGFIRSDGQLTDTTVVGFGHSGAEVIIR